MSTKPHFSESWKPIGKKELRLKKTCLTKMKQMLELAVSNRHNFIFIYR